MQRLPDVGKISAHLFLLLFLVFSLGCSAAQLALTKKDLDVQTKMSDSIFLDIEDQAERTVLVDVRDTTGKSVSLRSMICTALAHRGYSIVSDPKKAAYIVQINVLSCTKTSTAAVEKNVGLGYAGTIGTGAITGALIGTATHSPYGMGTGAAVGGLAGGVGELVTGSLVKDVTYALLTDVQITERLSRGKKVHRTRMASTANQVNLSYEDAKYPLEEAMANSLAGIF